MNCTKEDFQQIKIISYIKEGVGTEVWFIAYKNLQLNGGFYCALIDNDLISKSMSSTSWDLSIGDGMPSCTSYGYLSDNEQIKYTDTVMKEFNH